MKKILLLSDTHSYLDDCILAHAQKADEIWHAGDIGNRQVLDRLQALKPVRAVYGNIDDATIRNECPENQIFELEGVKVLMTHIGGYPPKYVSRVKDLIKTHQPQLYICGHSHILKVMPDPKFHLLHMNPGAAGIHGFQQVRTMLRFELNAGRIENLEVIEFDQ